MTHICVSKLTINGSDNGLSPGRRQAIIWTNAGILLLWTLRNKLKWNLNRNSHIFINRKRLLKMSSGRWRPFCLGLHVLKKGLHTTLKYQLFAVTMKHRHPWENVVSVVKPILVVTVSLVANCSSITSIIQPFSVRRKAEMFHRKLLP